MVITLKISGELKHEKVSESLRHWR